MRVAIPGLIPEASESKIYQQLIAEMGFAKHAVDGGYETIALHMKVIDETHSEFSVKTDPNTFTDLIASACVIAQATLLRNAAAVLGWTLDEAKIDQLISEASAINDAAAAAINEDAARS
jgi:hypothetical protein